MKKWHIVVSIIANILFSATIFANDFTQQQNSSKKNDTKIKYTLNANNLNGIWTTDRFAKDINRTLSPYYAARESSTEIFISDTSRVIWNYYEGSTFLLNKIVNDTAFLICTENSELVIRLFELRDSTIKCRNCSSDSVEILRRITKKNISTQELSAYTDFPDMFKKKYLDGMWEIFDRKSKAVRRANFKEVIKFGNGTTPRSYDLSFSFPPDVPGFDFVKFSNMDSVALFHIKIYPDSIYLYDIDRKLDNHDVDNSMYYAAITSIGKLHFILKRKH